MDLHLGKSPLTSMGSSQIEWNLNKRLFILQFHSHSEEVLIVKADDFIVIIVKL